MLPHTYMHEQIVTERNTTHKKRTRARVRFSHTRPCGRGLWFVPISLQRYPSLSFVSPPQLNASICPMSHMTFVSSPNAKTKKLRQVMFYVSDLSWQVQTTKHDLIWTSLCKMYVDFKLVLQNTLHTLELTKVIPRPAGVFSRTRPAGGGGIFCPPA